MTALQNQAVAAALQEVAVSTAAALEKVAAAPQSVAAAAPGGAMVAPAVAAAALQDPVAEAKAAEDRKMKEDLKYMEDRAAKLGESVHRKSGQVFIIMNLYYYFQGVILAVSAALKTPKCNIRQVLVFFALSLIPFFLHFFSLLMTVYSYYEDKKELKIVRFKYEEVRDGNDTKENDAPIMDKNVGGYESLVVVTVYGFFLTCFNVSILYACYTILCGT